MSTMQHQAHNIQIDQQSTGGSPQNVRLACPFCKRYPEHHVRIDGACTERFGFDSVRSVNEHIKRGHSLKFGCLECKTRFSQCKESNVQEKQSQHKCTPRDFIDSDPIFMNEFQEKRWVAWKKGNDAKPQDDIVKKWNDIYKSLFSDPDGTFVGPYPSPFYDYLQPSYRVRLENMRLRLSQSVNGNLSESTLLRRVEKALHAAESLHKDFQEIQSAFHQVDPDLAHDQDHHNVTVQPQNQEIDLANQEQNFSQPRSGNSLMPLGGHLAPHENTTLGHFDPSLGSSPYSLDHDAASLKRRRIHQDEAKWTTHRFSDSGYGSIGPSQPIQGSESPAFPTDSHFPSTERSLDGSKQKTQVLGLEAASYRSSWDNTLSGVAGNVSDLPHSLEPEVILDDEDIFDYGKYGSENPERA